MKFKNVILALSFGSFLALPTAMAQGFDFTEDEGFTFTEEEIQAENQRALQSLISDGARYLSESRQAYRHIISSINTLCNDITKRNDWINATLITSPATHHKAGLNYIMDRYPFAPDSGQFLEGVLSRSVLKKAKPNLTSAQYNEIERIITRCEALVKWYSGTLAKTCAAFDDDFLKILQQTARFREDIQLSNIQPIDRDFDRMYSYFTYNGDTPVLHELLKYAAYKSSCKSIANEWVKYFGSSPDAAKIDLFLNWAVFASGNYTGPYFGLRKEINMNGLMSPDMYLVVRNGKTTYANTEKARYMQYYVSFFDPWTDQYIDSVNELGSYLRKDVEKVFDEAEALAEVGGKDSTKEDELYRNLVKSSIPNMCVPLVDMSDMMIDLEEVVKKKTNFMTNTRRFREGGNRTLLQKADIQVQRAHDRFQQIHKHCLEFVNNK